VPNGFYVPGNADESPPLQGDLNDLTVADIQTALNAAGANLEVDGIAGDLTRAALENYRENTQLTEWNDVFVSLGLADTSPEATITRLSAGSWWWELECGALEAVGLITLC